MRRILIMAAIGSLLIASLALAGKPIRPRKALFVPPPAPEDITPAQARPYHGPPVPVMEKPMPIAVQEARRRILAAANDPPRYEGTEIKIGIKAPANQLRIQGLIAAKLSALDQVPPARRAHFAWTHTRASLFVTKWQGMIEGLSADAGGYLARVKIWPILVTVPGGNLEVNPDCVIEIYRYADGQITLVDTIDPGQGPVFP